MLRLVCINILQAGAAEHSVQGGKTEEKLIYFTQKVLFVHFVELFQNYFLTISAWKGGVTSYSLLTRFERMFVKCIKSGIQAITAKKQP